MLEASGPTGSGSTGYMHMSRIYLYDPKGCARGGFRDLASALDYLAKNVRAEERAHWLVQTSLRG